MKNYLEKFFKFRDFLGSEVWSLFIISISVGILWFMVESSFIFVLQGFLVSIKLVSEKDTFLPNFYPKDIAGSLIFLLLFGLFRALVIMLKNYFAETTNQAFVKVQRQRILEYSISNAHEVSSSEVLNIFGERVPQSATVIQMISSFLNTSIATICFMGFGLYLAPYELVIGLSILGILYMPFSLLNKFIVNEGIKLVSESKLLSKVLNLGLRNNFLLKIYNLTSEEVKKGKVAAENYERFFKKYILLSSIKSAFPQFAGALVLTIVCLISLKWINSPAIKLVSFIYIFMRLAQSSSELAHTLSNIRFNLPNFKDLYSWHKLCSKSLKKQVDLIEPSKTYHSNINEVTLSVNDVFHHYQDSEELFNGISFELKTGDIFLIKGRSGSGKSTLLSILMGIIQPNKGIVLYNKHKIKSVRNLLASDISYVGPESYIIEGSIRDNLIYATGLKNVSDEILWKVIKKAHLFDLVNSFDGGLDRELREVTELSTGQKQRLAIARALVRNPKILVFDEATANLDFETELELIKTIKTLSKDMITILISHKGSFDSIANKVLDLEIDCYSKEDIEVQNA